MSAGICKGCGRMTNSTTSNWWSTKDRKPTKCYVAWDDNGYPVKGCGYNDIDDPFDKHFADHVIRGGKKDETLCPKCGKWVPKRYKESHPKGCGHAIRKFYSFVFKKLRKEMEEYFERGGENVRAS